MSGADPFVVRRTLSARLIALLRSENMDLLPGLQREGNFFPGFSCGDFCKVLLALARQRSRLSSVQLFFEKPRIPSRGLLRKVFHYVN